MKKIFALCMLLLIPFAMFADGTILTAGNVSVTVTSSQAGDLCFRTNNNSITLTASKRDELLTVLKSHLDVLNTMQAEKISIRVFQQTKSINAQYKDEFVFHVGVNSDPLAPYILNIWITDRYREAIIMNIEQLQSLITALDSSSVLTDNYTKQNKRVEELLDSLRK